MRPTNEKGLTLVELLVSLTIMGIIAAAAMPLLSISLEAHSQGTARSRLYQEGLMAMERMTRGVKRCTFLLIPNAHKPTRDILAFSGTVNDDDDYYFNDPLFPRIDEDTPKDMNNDNLAGIEGFDDNGNAVIDDGAVPDDDEDSLTDEEILNGVDDDGDGNIDEDLSLDFNGDHKPGIEGVDDDNDGTVDEMDPGVVEKDNDEDGVYGEDPLNPIIYSFDSTTGTLNELLPFTGESVDLSTHVTLFQVTYEAPDATHGPRIQIALTLTGDDGESVQFVEYADPRNTLQKTGKRVR